MKVELTHRQIDYIRRNIGDNGIIKALEPKFAVIYYIDHEYDIEFFIDENEARQEYSEYDEDLTDKPILLVEIVEIKESK